LRWATALLSLATVKWVAALMAMADKDGQLLEGGKLFQFDVPANMPVNSSGPYRL
jgi:hypothetical protein